MVSHATKSISLFSIVILALLVLLTNISPSIASPSKGYCVLPTKDITLQIAKIAKSMLGNPMGTCKPFAIGDKNYQGCVEYHWNKIKGKHKGVTVYVQCPGE
jgi:hypothetical protein